MNKFLKGAAPRIVFIALSALLQIGLWLGLISLMSDYAEWAFAILFVLDYAKRRCCVQPYRDVSCHVECHHPKNR